ncbi:unnamed protein product [Periconia digitata]|uniref:Uncharacterized protein n=1 Tax=Periconia digitata TaxID=1303443 RepID=A0A9W4U7T8_9PLEO|nr:unnamed protein product [Periconia digitata]
MVLFGLSLPSSHVLSLPHPRLAFAPLQHRFSPFLVASHPPYAYPARGVQHHSFPFPVSSHSLFASRARGELYQLGASQPSPDLSSLYQHSSPAPFVAPSVSPVHVELDLLVASQPSLYLFFPFQPSSPAPSASPVHVELDLHVVSQPSPCLFSPSQPSSLSPFVVPSACPVLVELDQPAVSVPSLCPSFPFRAADLAAFAAPSVVADAYPPPVSSPPFPSFLFPVCGCPVRGS